MVRFGSERISGLFEQMGDIPIENKTVSKAISSAQKRVEGLNFDIRKALLDYDDVMRQQRETMYAQRNYLLEKDKLEKKAQADKDKHDLKMKKEENEHLRKVEKIKAQNAKIEFEGKERITKLQGETKQKEIENNKEIEQMKLKGKEKEEEFKLKIGTNSI